MSGVFFTGKIRKKTDEIMHKIKDEICRKTTNRGGNLNRLCQFIYWKILLFCTKNRRIWVIA